MLGDVIIPVTPGHESLTAKTASRIDPGDLRLPSLHRWYQTIDSMHNAQVLSQMVLAVERPEWRRLLLTDADTVGLDVAYGGIRLVTKGAPFGSICLSHICRSERGACVVFQRQMQCFLVARPVMLRAKRVRAERTLEGPLVFSG